MKSVKVEVLSVRANEQVGASIIREKRKGDTWNRISVADVVSGTPEANRTILLEDDERIIVEGGVNRVMVYDPEQNAAKLVDADPGVREAQTAAEQAQREANIRREEVNRRVVQGQALGAQQNTPKTNLGNPTQPRQTPPPANPAVPHGPVQGGAGPATNQTKPGDTGQGARASTEVKK